MNRIYIDINTNTILDARKGNNSWPFDSIPKLPLKYHGQLWFKGWDIPTRFAIDTDGQWWMDNAHGHPLYKCTKKNVIDEVEDDADRARVSAINEGAN